jgi:hypothetical protein
LRLEEMHLSIQIHEDSFINVCIGSIAIIISCYPWY